MFYKPENETLKQIVQCYWFIEHNQIPAQTKMLPDGYSDIMINLGEPYSVTYNTEKEIHIHGSAYFGQRTKMMYLNQSGKVNMIGIRINPGYEFRLIGKPAYNYSNNILSLQELMSEDFNTYISEIKIVRESESKLKLTEELLLNHLSKSEIKSDENMLAALNSIFKNKGCLTINELNDQLNLSYKQLERVFKKHLGLSPKTYIRIIRFYHTYTQIRAIKRVNWTDLLRQYNYYDQSHFIKDYHYFTGVSPKNQFANKDTIDSVFNFL